MQFDVIPMKCKEIVREKEGCNGLLEGWHSMKKCNYIGGSAVNTIDKNVCIVTDRKSSNNRIDDTVAVVQLNCFSNYFLFW